MEAILLVLAMKKFLMMWERWQVSFKWSGKVFWFEFEVDDCEISEKVPLKRSKQLPEDFWESRIEDG